MTTYTPSPANLLAMKHLARELPSISHMNEIPVIEIPSYAPSLTEIKALNTYLHLRNNNTPRAQLAIPRDTREVHGGGEICWDGRVGLEIPFGGEVW